MKNVFSTGKFCIHNRKPQAKFNLANVPAAYLKLLI